MLERLSDHFTSTWKLLSETTNFLSKASILNLYENDLKAMRLRLGTHGSDKETITEVRNQIIEIRKALRLSGYDLTLGDYSLIVDEFKNDAAINSHRRMVMFIGKSRLWILAGEANHNTLFDYLSAEKHGPVQQFHFLWYRWEGRTLFLSGSDSEEKDNFEALRKWSELPENRFMVLRHMKKHYR